MARLRYLLLQVRNAGDPMRVQEVACFTRALQCGEQDIEVFDLLEGAPPTKKLQEVDVVMLGGSGHYSAAGEGTWLDQALDAMRELHRISKPTFASCWGFQAMSRAMGGRCIRDQANAEMGTVELQLTQAGRVDPLFGSLPSRFTGQAGHEDHVVELPPNAVLLASSDRVRNQAFRFEGRPIYCTQFHPELDRRTIVERARAYPEYIERIMGIPLEEFERYCQETPEANSLILRFVEMVFGPTAAVG